MVTLIICKHVVRSANSMATDKEVSGTDARGHYYALAFGYVLKQWAIFHV